MTVKKKKSYRWAGFIQGLIHQLCAVSFLSLHLPAWCNFIPRLLAFKVATWSPAATKAVHSFSEETVSCFFWWFPWLKVEVSFQNPSVSSSPHLLSSCWETAILIGASVNWSVAWLGNSEHGVEGLPRCSDSHFPGLSLLCNLNCFQERSYRLKRNDFINAQALVLSHKGPGQKPSQEGKRRWISTFFFKNFFIDDWFLAVLPLGCWGGHSPVAVLRLLSVVALLVAEHGL